MDPGPGPRPAGSVLLPNILYTHLWGSFCSQHATGCVSASESENPRGRQRADESSANSSLRSKRRDRGARPFLSRLSPLPWVSVCGQACCGLVSEGAVHPPPPGSVYLPLRPYTILSSQSLHSDGTPKEEAEHSPLPSRALELSFPQRGPPTLVPVLPAPLPLPQHVDTPHSASEKAGCSVSG